MDDDGKYTVDTDHYAYIKSEYILYTITETGLCDVYLNGGEDGGAIQVTADNPATTSKVVPDSMRVGITVQDLDGTTPVGDEELVLVYAPKNETGKGNDATAIDGWTYVKDITSVAPVTYPHVYEKTIHGLTVIQLYMIMPQPSPEKIIWHRSIMLLRLYLT